MEISRSIQCSLICHLTFRIIEMVSCHPQLPDEIYSNHHYPNHSPFCLWHKKICKLLNNWHSISNLCFLGFYEQWLLIVKNISSLSGVLLLYVIVSFTQNIQHNIITSHPLSPGLHIKMKMTAISVKVLLAFIKIWGIAGAVVFPGPLKLSMLAWDGGGISMG